MGEQDPAQFLAVLGPAVLFAAIRRQLGHLAGETGGRGLAAGIRVSLAV